MKSTRVYQDSAQVNKVVFNEEFKQRGSSKVFLFMVNQQTRKYADGWGKNDDYGFELGKKGDEDWTLRHTDVAMSQGGAIPFLKNMSEDFAISYSPYALPFKGALLDLAKRSGFHVTSSENLRSPRGETRKVWFRVFPDDTTGQRIPEGKGWVILDPASYWRILEIEIPFDGRKCKETAKYSYEIVDNNYPLIKRVESKIVYSQGRAPTLGTVTFEIEKRVASADEFRLPYFGLPEPILPNRSWWRRTYVWLSVAAIICVGAVLLIRRLAVRGRMAPCAKNENYGTSESERKRRTKPS
jgi:hypothetical protein